MIRRQFFNSSAFHAILPQPQLSTRPTSPFQFNEERWLYARISGLLRLNRHDVAVSLYRQKVAAIVLNRRNDLQSGRYPKPADYKSLLRTAQLFRSYGHPQLTIEALDSLRVYMDSIVESEPKVTSSNTQAAVLFMQACNEVVWKPIAPEKLSDCSKSRCHHTELGKLIARVQNKPDLQKTSDCTTSQKQNVTGHQSQQTLTVEESKVLEVILGTLIKLGEPDWLISILRETFPRFITQLGSRLYPVLHRQKIETTWQPNDIPPGRLVKFLVAVYTLSGDLDRAYIVWRFHRHIWNSYMSESPRDPAPDISMLRALSRTSHITVKHLRMTTKILEGLQTDNVPVDTYVLEGLMDLRYRLRRHWSLRRPHAVAFHILQTLLLQSIGTFLLHWRRPLKFENCMRDVGTSLIKGAQQGQRQLMAWQYRPTARSFTLTLLSLRSELKHQTRFPIRHTCSAANRLYRVDLDSRSSKPRPSPGCHRSLICQLLALEAINASNWTSPVSQINSIASFPKRLRLLTPNNLKLCLEVFLCARDYAGACLVLRNAPYFPQTPRLLFELIIKEIPGPIKHGLMLPDDYESFLKYTKMSTRHSGSSRQMKTDQMNVVKGQPTMLSDDDHTDLDVFKAFEVLLRCCEPNRSDSWWHSELAAVYRRLDREHKWMVDIVDKPALSEFTLDFLRKSVARIQYDQVSKGSKY